jgi:hypothetical protein
VERVVVKKVIFSISGKGRGQKVNVSMAKRGHGQTREISQCIEKEILCNSRNCKLQFISSQHLKFLFF